VYILLGVLCLLDIGDKGGDNFIFNGLYFVFVSVWKSVIKVIK